MKKFISSLLIVFMLTSNFYIDYYKYNVIIKQEIVYADSILYEKMIITGGLLLTLLTGITYNSVENMKKAVQTAFSISSSFMDFVRGCAIAGAFKITSDVINMVNVIKNEMYNNTIEALVSDGYTFYLRNGNNTINVVLAGSSIISGAVELYFGKAITSSGGALGSFRVNQTSNYTTISFNINYVANGSKYDYYFNLKVTPYGQTAQTIYQQYVGTGSSVLGIGDVEVGKNFLFKIVGSNLQIILNGVVLYTINNFSNIVSNFNEVGFDIGVRTGDIVISNPTDYSWGESVSSDSILDKVYRIPDNFEDIINKTSSEIISQIDEINNIVDIISLKLDNIINEVINFKDLIVGKINDVIEGIGNIGSVSNTTDVPYIDVQENPYSIPDEDIDFDNPLNPGRPLEDDYLPESPSLPNIPLFNIPFLSSLLFLIISIIILLGKLIMMMAQLYTIAPIEPNSNIAMGINYIRNINLGSFTIMQAVTMVGSFMLSIVFYKVLKKVLK